MSEISQLGFLTVFVAGVVSFLSPCVLPLVPAYVSYVAGHALARHEKPAERLSDLALSVCFALGFSTVFVALGASASALGQLLIQYRYEANIAGGVVVIALGLVMIGALRLPWLARDVRFHGRIGGAEPVRAYLIGVAFAFGWTPCIGPVLGAILTASAVAGSASDGVMLLAVYSFGLAVPFLVTAVFAGRAVKPLKAMRRVSRPLQIAAGIVMIVMGIAMITGHLTTFALWLLKIFPALATIG